MLSVPEIAREGKFEIPERVRELVSDTTYVLLNKTDLASSKESALAATALRDCSAIWTTSLASGEGMEKFLSEFGELLSQR